MRVLAAGDLLLVVKVKGCCQEEYNSLVVQTLLMTTAGPCAAAGLTARPGQSEYISLVVMEDHLSACGLGQPCGLRLLQLLLRFP